MSLIVSNLAIMAIMMIGLWPMFRILEAQRFEGFLILLVLVPLMFVAVGAVSALMSSIADYRRITWSDLPQALRKTWKGSVLFAISVTLFFALTVLGMNYYSSVQSLIGVAAAAVLFWISLGVYLSTMWFFAVRNRLSGGFGKSLKKSALIMLDNLGVSLFAGLILIPVQMVLWPITAFGGFGPAGIQLYFNVSLRLLMYKYDWLEEHPDSNKREVPWFELLVDEKERVGKRTIKGMIFPWKE